MGSCCHEAAWGSDAVSDRPPEPDPAPEPEREADRADADLDTSNEPEPEWAEGIRRARRHRADRVRELLEDPQEDHEEPPT